MMSLLLNKKVSAAVASVTFCVFPMSNHGNQDSTLQKNTLPLIKQMRTNHDIVLSESIGGNNPIIFSIPVSNASKSIVDYIFREVTHVLNRTIDFQLRYESDLNSYFFVIMTDEHTFENDYDQLERIVVTLEEKDV